MFRPPTPKALACLLIVCATALLGCGDTTTKVKTPKSWLHIPITLAPGTRLQFRVDIEQQLSAGAAAHAMLLLPRIGRRALALVSFASGTPQVLEEVSIAAPVSRDFRREGGSVIVEDDAGAIRRWP